MTSFASFPATASSVPLLLDLASVDSTNSVLAQMPDAPPFSVVSASHQTAGRGRQSRQWISKPRESLALSVVLPVGFHKALPASWVPLVVGLAMVETLREFGVPGVGMKWPNDIIVGQGKLAGILIELELAASSAYVVAGIGVNLSKEPVLREGPGQLVSAVADQLSLGRNALCSLIIDRMVMSMNQVSSHHIAKKIAGWTKYDRYSGREVVVHRGDEQIVGINGGIDERGNLLLDLGTEIRSFGSGEVSLRKTESNL